VQKLHKCGLVWCKPTLAHAGARTARYEQVVAAGEEKTHKLQHVLLVSHSYSPLFHVLALPHTVRP